MKYRMTMLQTAFIAAAVVISATPAQRVLADEPKAGEAAAIDEAATDAQIRLHLHVPRPLARTELAQLAAAGVSLQAIGGGRYIATAKSADAVTSSLHDAALAATISPWSIENKVDKSLLDGKTPPWAVKETPDGRVAVVNVLFHRDVDLADAEPIVKELNGETVSRIRSLNGLVVKLPEQSINALALQDDVLGIESPLPPFSPMNDGNRLLTQAEQVQASPYNLDGSGVHVMVYDGGPAATMHPDITGRINNRLPFGGVFSDHSTHVSGTIGGDGTASGGLYRGMAPGVNIEVYWPEFTLPDQPVLEDLLGLFFMDTGHTESRYIEASSLYNAVVANNSIGLNLHVFAPFPQACLLYGKYGSTAAVIDSLTRGEQADPMIICWAAGNPGSASHASDCGFDYGSLSPPSNTKNAIVVGAVHSDTDVVTHFSARGPTRDGRLKPDIVAPGCEERGDGGVTSLHLNGGYLTACGTSMATPTVTGLVALMIQDHRDHHPGQPDIRNSTAKAVLVHTAVDLETPGPTYSSGYGSVRVKDAIDLMRAGLVKELLIDHRGVVEYAIEIEPSDAELKVTIAWDDPPAAPDTMHGSGTSPKLINDIDLHVYSPSGERHYPWTLDPANPTAPAVQTSVDRRNNVEQVYVADPTPGIWQIRIHGYDVPVAPQLVSIAATPRIDFEPSPVFGDLNGDGVVNVSDLLILLGAWGPCPRTAACSADLNGDGVVDVSDLLLLFGAWG